MKWRLKEGDSILSEIVSKGKILYEANHQSVGKKAEADYKMASQLSRSKTPLHDGVCFHCRL